METTLNSPLATQELELKSIEPNITPAADADVINYLRHTHQLAQVATLAEQTALVLTVCQQLGLSISEAELQTAGDTFRTEYKLLSAAETMLWLGQQRLTAEEWAEGIRVQLLTQKLKEHLFSDAVDSHYLNERDAYRRVALSQILVAELAQALDLKQQLLAQPAAFCSLALTHSLGKQSRETGGFVGIRFVSELIPEIAAAVVTAQQGTLLDPIQTRAGYHLIRVEKWFPVELNTEMRETVMSLMFQQWLQVTSSAVKASASPETL